jgi:type II secretory pathway pseudopilin PulG
MSDAARRRAKAVVEETRRLKNGSNGSHVVDGPCKPPPAASQPAKAPGSGSGNGNRSYLLYVIGSLLTAAVPTALALREAIRLQEETRRLEAELWEERAARAAAERRYTRYEELQPRADNFQWQEDLQAQRKQKEAFENSDDFVNALFDDASNQFPDGANLDGWVAHLRNMTPSRFDLEGTERTEAPAFCKELGGIVIPEADLRVDVLSVEVRARALRALTECGYLYLDNLIHKHRVERSAAPGRLRLHL